MPESMPHDAIDGTENLCDRFNDTSANDTVEYAERVGDRIVVRFADGCVYTYRYVPELSVTRANVDVRNTVYAEDPT